MNNIELIKSRKKTEHTEEALILVEKKNRGKLNNFLFAITNRLSMLDC